MMILTVKIKPLLISILIALSAGLLGAILGGGMASFNTLIKPSFAPTAKVFPIIWTILYILMGISAYFIYMSKDPLRKKALIIYGIQLIVNSLWTLIFFRLDYKLLAFFWIILLIILVGVMVYLFYKISPIAAYLQIPYFVWLVFAAILNFSIYMLNKPIA